MFAETTVLDVAIAIIGTFGALATSGAAIAAAFYAHKAHAGVKEAAPVIQAIDNAVNGRAPGEPTMSEDAAASRARDEAQDSAVGDPNAEVVEGSADKAAHATGAGSDTELDPQT